MRLSIVRAAAGFFTAALLCADLSFAEVMPVAAPAESDQQINDFSFSGYGERGKKTWDIAGKSADIFADNIRLKEITGNMYGDEDVKLTAEKGDFNKAEGKIHLEEDVVITTESGAKLTTDSLDWDRKNDVVTTKDKVNIVRDNLIAEALGAMGKPALSKVNLEKEVKVQIIPEKDKDQPPATEAERIIITCDGPLAIDYAKNFATFSNNVRVDRDGSQIYSDTMDVYFNTGAKAGAQPETAAQPEAGLSNSKIEKIVCRGNVKIIRGPNVSYSDEAIYSALENKITLLGRPKLVLYSTEEMDAPSGN
ncbi:MAG: LPS export ABC transporter periplasmic protein LptC [Candidatus Omnitrophota bacterium]